MARNLLNGGDLLLYGDVGDPFGWGDGFTPGDVANALAEHGGGKITARINSGGGIAVDGMAIYSLLKAHPAKVTIVVDGVAASAASLIAMAGATIEMRQGAMVMIHDPSAVTRGTVDAHRKAANDLDKLANNYAAVYGARAGKTVDETRTIMKDETWFTADEAVEAGFADKTVDEPSLAMAQYDYRIYANAPKELPVRMRTSMETAIAKLKGKVTMPKPQAADAVVDDKPWAGNFFMVAKNSRLPIDQLNEIVASADDYESARDGLIDAMAAAQNTAKPGPGPSGATFDNPQFLGKSIEDALYCRMSGKTPEGPAREWAGQSLLEIGKTLLAASGQRVRMGGRDELAKAIMSYRSVGLSHASMAGGHSTSDFPGLLTLSGTRVLMDAYNVTTTPLKTVAARRDAPDFRAISMLRLSEGPELLLTPENSEVKYGSMSELKEGFSIVTFARKFALTRQALINDDLGAFSDQARLLGRGAGQAEANLFVGLLTANGGNGALLSDGKALYHADHANKAASGAALAIPVLNSARQAMRQQTGADGKTLIDVPPRYLVVGAALEGTAEQVISSYYPAKAEDVNPFAQKLVPLVEPRLTGNAWRLFTDPANVPALGYAYLNGQNGPILEAQEGWDILGIEFRAILDFGAGAIDSRATYLNPGP